MSLPCIVEVYLVKVCSGIVTVCKEGGVERLDVYVVKSGNVRRNGHCDKTSNVLIVVLCIVAVGIVTSESEVGNISAEVLVVEGLGLFLSVLGTEVEELGVGIGILTSAVSDIALEGKTVCEEGVVVAIHGEGGVLLGKRTG